MADVKDQPADRGDFTDAVDRRVMEGYLGDRGAMFIELGSAGFSRSAIVRRGVALGLSASFLSKCKMSEAEVSVRDCLCCDHPFVSFGRQNRLCKRCRAKR